jgi:cyanate lyase
MRLFRPCAYSVCILSALFVTCSAYVPAPHVLLRTKFPASKTARPLRGARLTMLNAGNQHDAADQRTARLLACKIASGKSWDDIANALGLQNAYTCQLFLGQAQLKPETAEKLKHIIPSISDEDLNAMMLPPMRGFNSEILKEPNVYRTYEAITHYGEAIKMLINEQCGDGIMSAIDFYLDVGSTVGKLGEKRVVITFNGKFLPFIEQKSEDNTLGPGPRAP